jgi:hypothetical protein
MIPDTPSEESAMDGLIRELEQLEAEAEARMRQVRGATVPWVLRGELKGIRKCIERAHAAKRRMTEREPAWDLG